MQQSRFDEYLEHELLKRSQSYHPRELAQLRHDIQECINRGRIVVAFRNARAFAGDAGDSGRNPVWYTDD